MSNKNTTAIPTAQTAPSPSPETNGASRPRYFEFIGGTSYKFWAVSRCGCELTTRWGRIGSAGQSKTKSFADEASAAKAAEKLVAEKTSEGYIEK